MIRQSSVIFLAMLACTAASPTWAADNRIRRLRYDPDQIVTLPGKPSIQSTIEFGLDEHIESVAVGNSAAWQVTPNHRASLLFVKPLVRWSRTNMTVITDKRTYMFDLVTGRREATAVYALKFSYPEDLVEKAKLEQARLVTPTPVPSPPAPIQYNFGWKTKGTTDLVPARVFDDGTHLYLAWTQNVALPAISTVAEDGREASLNYRLAGDYIVVTPVPSNITMRYGKKWSSALRAIPDRPQPAQSGAVREAEGRPSLPAPVSAPSTPPNVAQSGQSAISQPPLSPRSSEEQRADLVKKFPYPSLADEHLTDSHQ